MALGTLGLDLTFAESMALFDSVDARHTDEMLDESEFQAGLFGDLSGLASHDDSASIAMLEDRYQRQMAESLN